MSQKAEDEKLGELLLMLAKSLQDEPAAGATKLNKLAFFAELTSVRITGKPITGGEYQRLPNGPAPRRLVPVRTRLLQEGAATLREESYLGVVQHRLVPAREPRLELFSTQELQSVNQVLAVFGAHTGNALSNLSHQQQPWNLVKEGETIPFASAYLKDGPPSARAMKRGNKLAAQHRASA